MKSRSFIVPWSCYTDVGMGRIWWDSDEMILIYFENISLRDDKDTGEETMVEIVEEQPQS